ncbi:MAG: hypothetical protein J6Y78_06160 [Paludibacteraceae bacterium]|nr:hypothetical protein [Paludibacteraceae bacterium]
MAKKKEIKNVIYTNNYSTNDYEDAYREYLEDNNLTDDDIDFWTWANEDQEVWLGAEKANLNVPCNKVVIIGKISLWNGIRKGMKFLGENVNSIFNYSMGDFVEFFADRYNVCCTDAHHDGTNHYTYRELKDGVTEEMFERAFTKAKHIDSKFLCRYTNSLRPKVAKVYGW